MGNSVSLNRLQKIKQLRQNPDIQVLIVGAGVNGIGLFRELALQGIYVALIDEGDFGTDSPIAISHLVHGDVYYRENGGFGSAETAVLERQRLLQNAPHVVIPMPTTVPIFRWVTGRFHVPIKLPKEALKTGRRGLFFTRLGLMLQDKMLGSKVDSFKHRFAFRKKSLKQFPRLNPNILGTVSYYNATIIAPERLCTDLLWDGCEASPQSVPLNYFGQTALDGDSVTVTDFITGETVQLRPQLVINTKDCPPQTDNIHRQQGLHLVLANSELRQVISNHSFFFEYENGRFIRIFPYHHNVLISTTLELTEEQATVDTVTAVSDSLEMVRQIFPTVVMQAEDIVYQKSECQPLNSVDTPYHLQITKAGTRAQFPIIDLHGGNWTTFRTTSAKITDQILEAFGHQRLQFSENLAIGGGKRYPYNRDERWRWFHKQALEYNLAFEHVKQLFNRYGTHTRDVAAFISAEADAPLKYHPDYTKREIAYLAKHEQVTHLDDLILRRTTLGKMGEATADLVTEIAQIVSQTLNWSPDQKQAEIERAFKILIEEHGAAIYS